MRTVQRVWVLPGIPGSFLMVDDGGPRVRPYCRSRSLSLPFDGGTGSLAPDRVRPLPGSDLSIRRDTGFNVWARVIEQVSPRRTAKGGSGSEVGAYPVFERLL